MEWIKVTDRLPKKRGHYLVSTPRSFPKNYKGQICEYYEDNETFYNEYDEPIEDCTHWTLLPEPPKINKMKLELIKILNKEQIRLDVIINSRLAEINHCLDAGKKVSPLDILTRDNAIKDSGKVLKCIYWVKNLE